MRYLALVTCVAFAFGAGCGDSNEGKTGETPNALFPNGKAYKVTTTIEPASIRAGESTTVTCAVVDTNGDPHETATTIAVTPMDGIVIDDRTVTAAASGTFTVVCSAPDVDVFDEDGATLTVEAGAPASVEAAIAPNPVRAGEDAVVTCNVKDADGGIISGVPTTVTAASGVTVDDHDVSATIAGDYEVTCAVIDAADLPSTPATLTVIAGDPVSVELLADPEKPAYARQESVQFSWVTTDAYGNTATDAPGTLSGPTAGVEVVGDPTENRYRFLEQGLYDWTVTLDAPSPTVTDDISLVCDDQGPVITITYPPRGATLVGADGEVVTVTGTVSDNLGTVDAIVVNGVAPAVDADGNFQADITPKWGTNFIEIYADDSHGVQGKLTPSFQYSSAYVSFVETNAQGVMVDDGVQALLGQGAIDDGVHDPTDVDDLATLLEVVLTNIDIPTLLESQGGAIVQTTTPIVDYSLGPASLTGDVIITVSVVAPTDIGPTSASLDSTTGGIDSVITMGTQTEQGLLLNLEIDIELAAQATAAGFNLGSVSGVATVPNQAQAQTITLQAKLVLDKPKGGATTAAVENLGISFSNLNLDLLQDVQFTFTLDIPFVGVQQFTVSLSDFGFNLQDLTDALIDPLISTLGGLLTDLLEPLLEDFVSDALQGLVEQFEMEFDFALPDFLGTGKDPVDVNVYTALSSALFVDQGGQIGLALGAYADKGAGNAHEPDGAIKRSGCLVGDTEQLAYDWSHELGFGLQTDSLNMVFFALWWSGFVHGPIDVSALLGDSSPIPIDNFTMVLDPFAAPVINDCSKAAGVQLELGDLKADISGDLLGLGIDATVFIDLQLLVNFVAEADGLYVEMDSIQFVDVEVVAVGADVSEADNRELLEEQLGPILGAFLEGERFGPIEIPGLDFGDLIPGMTFPAGTDTTLDLGPLEVSKDTGYVLVETDLD